MTTWYKQIGFEDNPLDSRPNPKLIGLAEEEEQLKNHIFKEEMCFLNGLTGSGKTSLLKRIQESMKDYSFVYLDADALPRGFDLMGVIKNKRSFLDKITFKTFPTKKPVLIIDEFQATDPNLILEARSNWENPNEKRIKSIVIAQISSQLRNVTGSFKDRLGNRNITLRQLDNDEMKKILKIRLEDKKNNTNYYDRLSEDAVNLLVNITDGNARRLLEYTDMIFDFHFRRFGDINPVAKKADYVVSYYAAKEILDVNGINVEGFDTKGDKVSGIRRTVSFEKLFKIPEQNALRCLAKEGSMTSDGLAKTLNIPLTKSKDLIKLLRNKDAIIKAGREGRKVKWQITQSTKRIMVKR